MKATIKLLKQQYPGLKYANPANGKKPAQWWFTIKADEVENNSENNIYLTLIYPDINKLLVYGINPHSLIDIQPRTENVTLAGSYDLYFQDQPGGIILKFLTSKGYISQPADPFLVASTNYADNSLNSKTKATMANHKISLNQILYGPPGTGKTYNTINKAISIINPSFDLSQNRVTIKKEFDNLVELGLIDFVTFHQSFSYEDFVEGIKPKTVEKKNEDESLIHDVIYEIEDGVFKRLCKRSIEQRQGEQIKDKKLINLSNEEFQKVDFYKLSLGDINNPIDDAIYEYCIENSCIAIGFGGIVDFSNKSVAEITRINEEKGFTSYSPIALNYFIHYAKIGDYVLISKGNRYIRAMAKLVGDYYFKEDSPIEYKHFRKVEWIFTDEEMPISEIYGRSLSQMTIYKFEKKDLRKDFFVPVKDNSEKDKMNNYVLIIDEINRGNIASIFGELITLIEDDKREGGKEALNTILPYSKEKFSVPSNVYILGTMNTADRSVEALDIALRRRFSFIEMVPNTNLLDFDVDNINIKSIVDTINLRIERLLDKDHSIGHAYFMSLENRDDLIDVFADKVIPLLEEYFFGDYSKIGLVLGSSFVKRVELDSNFRFADFDYDDQSDLLDKPIYELTNPNIWDFKSIL